MRYRDNKGPPANVLDPELYLAVKEEAKEKFDVYPSIYANSWLVREYKARGGRYADKKDNSDTGLKKWYEEEWVDMSRPIYDATGSIVDFEQCGRHEAHHITEGGDYPKCRPKADVMHMSDYEREMAVINKQIAEYSSPKTKGRKPTMAKTRSNPIEVVINEAGNKDISVGTFGRRLQSKNYAKKITEGFKNAPSNFKYYVYPYTNTYEYFEKVLPKLANPNFITLVANPFSDEALHEKLRQPGRGSGRSGYSGTLGPVTILHDLVETLMDMDPTKYDQNSKIMGYYDDELPYYGNRYSVLDEYSEADRVLHTVVGSILYYFRVVERSSPQVQDVVLSLVDQFSNHIAKSRDELDKFLGDTSYAAIRGSINRYFMLGVNSLMSRSGFSSNGAESMKDAIALAWLTPKSRPIFLKKIEIDPTKINAYGYASQRDVEEAMVVSKFIDTEKLSQIVRDIFDILTPFMYGSVMSLINPYVYIPRDLPYVDLK
jgi:hypothetical protein